MALQRVFFCFFRMHNRPSIFLWHSDMHCIFLEKHAKITRFRRSQRRRIELLSTLRIPTLSGKQVLVEKMCMKKQWWKHITCFVCCQKLAIHLLGITTTCHWSEAISGGSGYCRVHMKEPLCCLGWLRLKRQFSNGNRLIFDDIWLGRIENTMQPTNPNAHAYVNGTDIETHGYAVTQNTFLQ